MKRSRVYFAMGCYFCLAVLAGYTLDGPFRLGVWVFLGGLALKTWLAVLGRNQE